MLIKNLGFFLYVINTEFEGEVLVRLVRSPFRFPSIVSEAYLAESSPPHMLLKHINSAANFI